MIMRKTILKGIFLLSVTLTFSLLSGCLGSVQSEVKVIMTNNSNLDTHLWTTGEKIDPANKLAPGESRSKVISYYQEDGAAFVKFVNVTVYAGRNGVTLTSKTFGVMLQETITLNVVYSGSDLTSTN